MIKFRNWILLGNSLCRGVGRPNSKPISLLVSSIVLARGIFRQLSSLDCGCAASYELIHVRRAAVTSQSVWWPIITQEASRKLPQQRSRIRAKPSVPKRQGSPRGNGAAWLGVERQNGGPQQVPGSGAMQRGFDHGRRDLFPREFRQLLAPWEGELGPGELYLPK